MWEGPDLPPATHSSSITVPIIGDMMDYVTSYETATKRPVTVR